MFSDCKSISVVEHEARTLDRQEMSKAIGEPAYQPMPKLEFHDVTLATPTTVTPSECNRMEFTLSGDITSQPGPEGAPGPATSETSDEEKTRHSRIVLTPDGGLTLGPHVQAVFTKNNWFLPNSMAT